MKILSIIILMIISFFQLNATLYIVDNTPVPIGDYTTIQNAIAAVDNSDDALPGKLDTIFIYPSKNNYDPYVEIHVNKRVIIIGQGWEKFNDLETRIHYKITFEAGSEYSILSSLSIECVNINTNDITIKRVQFEELNILSNCLNIKILQSIFKRKNYRNIRIYNNCSVIIENNIFNCRYDKERIIIGNGNSITFANNIIASHLSYYNSIIIGLSNVQFLYNIIISNGPCFNSGYEPDFINNISNNNNFPTSKGNINNISPNDIFVDYHLKPGSPAGKENTGYEFDMGIYDGPFPFVDGGYPDIPLIIDFDSNFMGTPSEGLDVQIKAKSNR